MTTTALNVQDTLNTAVEAVDNKKANNIVALDMRKVSLMADYFVIADAASTRQVQAIATEVKDKIQEAGYRTVTPIIISNTDEFKNVKVLAKGEINEKAEMISVER